MSKQKWEDSGLQKKKIYNGVASEYEMSINNVETLGRWQDPTIAKLQQEKQQLSEKLGKYIEQRDEWVDLLQKYKEVIEEVREILTTTKIDDEGWTLEDIFEPVKKAVQILDKVKENTYEDDICD